MADNHIQETGAGAYVYEVVVDGVTRYIGKGRGRRARSHIQIAKRLIHNKSVGKKVGRSRFYAGLCAAIKDDASIEVRIIRDGMTDADAFELEQDEIGKAPLGQLWNSAPGGEGQSSEYLKSLFADPERREAFRRIAVAAWAANPDRKDARFAEPGSRERQSELVKAKWSDPEYRMKQSVARSKERPERRGVSVPALSSPAKTRWADPEFRARTTAAMVAAATPERSAAISQRLKEQWASPEFRAKVKAGRQKKVAPSKWPDGAYVYLYEVDGIIRYIGKGRKGRAAVHVRAANSLIKGWKSGSRRLRGYEPFHRPLAKAIMAGASVSWRFAKTGLGDYEALALEADMVSSVSDGQLWGGSSHTLPDCRSQYYGHVPSA